METQANDYRDCDTEHLRDYPGCYEECDRENCTGAPDADQATAEPPAQPEPGHTPVNPYTPDRWVCFDLADDWYKPTDAEAPHFTGGELAASKGAWEEGQVVGDAVGYAKGKKEAEAEKKQLRSVVDDLKATLRKQEEVVDALVEVCVLMTDYFLLENGPDYMAETVRKTLALIAKAKGES